MSLGQRWKKSAQRLNLDNMSQFDLLIEFHDTRPYNTDLNIFVNNRDYCSLFCEGHFLICEVTLLQLTFDMMSFDRNSLPP